MTSSFDFLDWSVEWPKDTSLVTSTSTCKKSTKIPLLLTNNSITNSLMCKSDITVTSDPPSVSKNDGSTHQDIFHDISENLHRSPSKTEVLAPYYAIPFLLISVHGALRFAQTFPFVLWYKGAVQYYIPAGYQYDEENTRFDNTIWTYGTDYTIAVVMLIGTTHCWTCIQGYKTLRLYCCGLLLSYGVSVLMGGIAHQNYLTLDSLNTPSFKLIWIICVGSVTLAGGFIGAIGTELATLLNGMSSRGNIPILPVYFWAFWGIYLTTAAATGEISYKRPACDIFVAGTTQTLPTVYTVLILLSRYWKENKKHLKKLVYSSFPLTSNYFLCYKQLKSKLSTKYRIIFTLGFFLNAPLLPMYPILLSYELPLSAVNTILHSTLLLAWGLQYLVLWKFCVALQESSSAISTSKSS